MAWMEKENKTIGTKRCEKIDTMRIKYNNNDNNNNNNLLTNSMAYGTLRFNATFTRALQ